MSRWPRSRAMTIAMAAAGGAALGWLIGGDTVWTIVGAVIGLGTAALIVTVALRPIVAIPVAIGAGIGAYIGGTIVGVLCEPDGCPAFEAGAATVTGIGAVVGIGLVVALATRSFDEYNEAVERGAQPPVTGCGGNEESD